MKGRTTPVLLDLELQTSTVGSLSRHTSHLRPPIIAVTDPGTQLEQVLGLQAARIFTRTPATVLNKPVSAREDHYCAFQNRLSQAVIMLASMMGYPRASLRGKSEDASV